MQNEKHEDALKEVENTIEEALKENILEHQRRIASMTSLGIQHIIELYFHKLNVMKPGASLKHEWFKLSEKNIRLRLSAVVTKKLDEIPRVLEILSIAREIEKDRNDLVYGAPLKDDKILRDKIDDFLEIKKIIAEESEEK